MVKPIPSSNLPWLSLVGAAVLLAPSHVRADDGSAPPEAASESAPPAAASESPPAPPAEPSLDGVDLEMAARASYLTPPIHGGTTPFGAGFGGRLGLSISNVYFGVTATDYLGGTDVALSDGAVLFGVELGYGFRIRGPRQSFFTLRPQIGVGDAAVSHTDPSLARADVVTSASGSSSSFSDTMTVHSLYLQPGLTVLYAWGMTFAGVNGSALVLPHIGYGGAEAVTWLSYGIEAQLGLRL